ncbi:hypothetical protein ASD44_10175 [Mesorhizobium sp. Root554]|uniref:hypothetical protein n=1 Tax=unclassified Mesorhizobium TaxID=325217 RepID=UPI0006F5C210|nr:MULTISPECIES: hypothetical protein [unclassified Mesorhizobium]KQZ14397.1 hypothetical protein ASD27_10185 [Mesorhizobium sp. Root1471]KQZ36907.1 hypothetical protein ASD44_10175 [Mesorhizobium sp. Root554]
MQESERQDAESMLREMLAQKQAEETVPARRKPLASSLSRFSFKTPRLFRRKRKSDGISDPLDELFAASAPKFTSYSKAKESRRSDLMIAALGVTLGLICAVFPWYIFFNPEQFGVQGIKFGGRGANAGRVAVERSAGNEMAPTGGPEKKAGDVDLFSTGTLPDRDKAKDKPPGPDQQPFPAAPVEYRLVHVANGRAMIEDDAGLWIVQRGSTLPDSSQVTAIEQRNGKWVLVTSKDRVVEISN